RERRLPRAVVEARYRVRPAVPAGVVERAARHRIAGRVAVRVVGEDVAGMVGDHVEDDVNPLLVRGTNEVAELLARAEVRVHIEEVLDAVAVIALLERDLSEWRADPQRSDAEPTQVTQLAGQALNRAPLPSVAGAEPRIVIDAAIVFGAVEGRGTGLR